MTKEFKRSKTKQRSTWGKILKNRRSLPSKKHRMHVPLCMMVSMPIVRPILKIEIWKMEHAFHMGHNEGDKVFKLSPMIGRVRRILLYTIESFLAIIFRGYGTSFFHRSFELGFFLQAYNTCSIFSNLFHRNDFFHISSQTIHLIIPT